MAWRDFVVGWIPFLEQYGSETVTGLTFSVVALAAGWLAWNAYRRFVLPAMERFAGSTPNVADDVLLAMVKAVRRWLFQAATIYAALLPWELTERSWLVAHRVLIGIAFFQLALVSRAGFHAFFDLRVSPHAATRPGLKTSLDLIRSTGVVVIFIVVGLFALSNLGFDISALVAGLGIGGIAVALGVQKVLADFFASLFIVLDRPFEAGESVSVGDVSGTVERVGLRTSRIRSNTGEEVVMANAELASARIRNFARLKERRCLLRFGLEYGTTAEQIERMVETARKIITDTPKVRLDRCHFVALAASSLDIEIVYYVESSDYELFMSTQQSVNLRVMRAVEAAGLSFAFPTQTVHVNAVSRA